MRTISGSRWASMLALAALLTSLLAGCGNSGSSAPATSPTLSTPTEATQETTIDVEQADDNSGYIGIIADSNTVFTEDDVALLCLNYGVGYETVKGYEALRVEQVEDAGSAAYQLVTSGYQTIIFTAQGSTGIAETFAQDFPDIAVIIADGWKNSSDTGSSDSTSNDPLEAFLVTEAEAKEWGGAYLVKSDGKLYTLNGVLSIAAGEKAGIGWKTSLRLRGEMIEGYALYRQRHTISSETGFVASDKVPIIEIGQDDKVISFIDGSVSFSEARVKDGYGLLISESSTNGCIITLDNGDRIIIDDPSTIEVVDDDGTVVLAGKQAIYGMVSEKKTYTVGWFEGTTYHEAQMTALDEYNRYASSMGSKKGTLNKAGYAEYDFSETPEGLYFIGAREAGFSGCIVRIVH